MRVKVAQLDDRTFNVSLEEALMEKLRAVAEDYGNELSDMIEYVLIVGIEGIEDSFPAVDTLERKKMWWFKKKIKKRPPQVVAMWALFQMLYAGLIKNVEKESAEKEERTAALCSALQVTRHYSEWTKEDDVWFWSNLKKDWKDIQKK
ncbi:MAG: hypothetical protein ABIG61_07175 [Planctomycetota bacterium]